MVRLVVREVAERQGLNMSQLQRKALLPMSTVQRYWHGVGGKGEPLTSIDLRHVDTLCEVLECEPGDLLRRVPESEAQP
jgi:DNA-binding Xre family transcriptional regulator